jgi:hypothetical protein
LLVLAERQPPPPRQQRLSGFRHRGALALGALVSAVLTEDADEEGAVWGDESPSDV